MVGSPVPNQDRERFASEVRRLDPTRRPDFFKIHSDDHDCGFCFCVAWWVPSWGWLGERTPPQNRSLRQSLFEHGEDDGYLLYQDGRPVAWTQVGNRDRLVHLVRDYRLEPDPDAWVITCFLVAPAFRRTGLASRLLTAVLMDLKAQGIQRVEAFPRRGGEPTPEHIWTGPEAMFLTAGSEVVRDDPRRPVLALDLREDRPAVV